MTYFIIWAWGVGVFWIVGVIFIAIDLLDLWRPIVRYFGYRNYHPNELGFSIAQFKMFVLASICLIISIILSFIFGKYYSAERKANLIIKKYRKQHPSDMLENVICDLAIRNTKLKKSDFTNFTYASVTMKSRKVYVGVAKITDFANGHPAFLSLIPMISGYRDEHKLTFKPRIIYYSHYAQDERFHGENPDEVFNNFILYLNRDEIEYISLFNLETYINFQDEEKEEEERRSTFEIG